MAPSATAAPVGVSRAAGSDGGGTAAAMLPGTCWAAKSSLASGIGWGGKGCGCTATSSTATSPP
ncbi:hypothetical protein RNZ50_21165 [Paracoccaceae bacterium Fryx2]|nr:hypothetical protein [Paracoccaceae bacterium Fryx2]